MKFNTPEIKSSPSRFIGSAILRLLSYFNLAEVLIHGNHVRITL